MSSSAQIGLCILGMHRSGTSAITRALNLAGVYLGEPLVGPNSHNPDGFWEREDVINIHERLLQRFDKKWDSVDFLPDKWWEDESLSSIKQDMRNIISAMTSEAPVIGWKDPRTCRFFRLWRLVFDELRIPLRVVIVFRHPLDVAKSLATRDGFSKSKSLDMWYLHQISALVDTQGMTRTVVYYDAFLAEPVKALEHIIRTLKLPLSQTLVNAEASVRRSVNPNLRNSSIGLRENCDSILPKPVEDLYRLLQEAAGDPSLIENTNAFESIRQMSELYVQWGQMKLTKRDLVPTFKCQVFWPENGALSEVRSRSVPGHADGYEHSYDIPIFLGDSEWLRYDPSDKPGMMSIQKLELYRKDAEHQLRLVKLWDLDGDEVQIASGIDPISEHGARNLFCFTNDPQLILHGIEQLTRDASYVFHVTMTMDPFGLDTANEFKELIELNQRDQGKLRNSLSEAMEILDTLQIKFDEQKSNNEFLLAQHQTLLAQLEEQSTEIQSGADRIKEQEVELTEMSRLLAEKTESLDKILEEVRILGDKIEELEYLLKMKEKQSSQLSEELNIKSSELDSTREELRAISVEMEDHVEQLSAAQSEADEARHRFLEQLRQLDEANRNLAETNAKLNEASHSANLLQEKVNRYENSHGYKLLKKYYTIRDRALPRDTTRYKIARLLFLSITQYRRLKPFISLSTGRKIIKHWRSGGIKSVVDRLQSKINTLDHSLYANRASGGSTSTIISVLSPNKSRKLKTKLIDVVVPVYNAFDYTVRCLEKVFENTDIPYNLIIVNDASTDHRISHYLRAVLERRHPRNLKHIDLIEHTTNMGFIRSVNEAIEASSNDIVLLNTDTEVPKGWLSRIVSALNDTRIASATPFSNSATTCSFPRFCEDNELPNGMTVEDIDQVFSEFGTHDPIDLPSGVGFCMALNREVIKEIGVFDADTFGKGYGEENDWCMRAHKAGFRNVLVTNLFVYHKHGVSFREHKDKSREARINANLEKLSKKHPEYLPWVDRFIGEDPIEPIRTILEVAVKARSDGRTEGTLFVNHSLGGGTAVYQSRYIDGIKHANRIYELTSQGKMLRILTEGIGRDVSFNLPMELLDSNEGFYRLLKLLNITRIYVNQLVTFPVFRMIQLIMDSNVPYVYFVHDYFSICPSYNLLNSNYHFCGNETDLSSCRACLSRGLVTEPWIDMKAKDIDIAEWRESFKKFLIGAENIIAPSRAAATLIEQQYSNVNVSVKEHETSDTLHYTFNEAFTDSDFLNVGFLGALGEPKGSQIIYALKELVEHSDAKIRMIVIGVTPRHQSFYTSDSGKFQVTGRYEANNVSDILAKHQIGVVVIPSVWPETFSYTTSEALLSGFPVVTFDIGAPADRVKTLEAGWRVSNTNAESLYEQLIHICNHRSEIRDRSGKLKLLFSSNHGETEIILHDAGTTMAPDA